MSKLVEVRGLHKSFVETGEEIRVLQGLDLELEEGEKIAIVGESGVGKSTLLHLLGTLDRPSSGQVIYRDRDLASLDEETLSELRNREIVSSSSSFIISCPISAPWRTSCFPRW